MSGAFPYLLRLKQGATLSLDLFFSDDNGAPIDLTQASSLGLLICDPFGNQVATPAITPAGETGWATVVAATAGWPYGALPCQASVTAGGITQISDTFAIIIERGVAA
nr:hypothetical protein [uncultured Rhodopila sp.]